MDLKGGKKKKKKTSANVFGAFGVHNSSGLLHMITSSELMCDGESRTTPLKMGMLHDAAV